MSEYAFEVYMDRAIALEHAHPEVRPTYDELAAIVLEVSGLEAYTEEETC